MRYFQRLITSPVDGIDYSNRVCINFSLSALSQKVNRKGVDGPAGN